MANLPPGTHVLSEGHLPSIRDDFSRRVQNQPDGDRLGATRKELADIAYGPTKIPLFNFLLQLTILNPPARTSYLEISRFLALEACVPVDSTDLSGTTAFMHSISTKPYWDPEFAGIMLKAGAEINRRNRYGCVAAHDIVMARDYSTAGQRKTVEALKWFVENGGDLDIKCGDGVSPRKMGIVPGRWGCRFRG
ncbi:Uncharacterized protein BP5553_06542 [Venustampulla echinocandica]|uniref:Ankyrin repeat-containing protein n=1 Tax=Venustampulla echinocandica TaxID=2656787 RepID=A0A370TK80_9HELO|nr:Uncharacterized protein BP5553_06542 [Venustampulla echinocandica]RDL35930.1 Uncharacterized protein BP5553_06542 [Venustampulla echinocandica]